MSTLGKTRIHLLFFPLLMVIYSFTLPTSVPEIINMSIFFHSILLFGAWVDLFVCFKLLKSVYAITRNSSWKSYSKLKKGRQNVRKLKALIGYRKEHIRIASVLPQSFPTKDRKEGELGCCLHIKCFKILT